MNEIITQLELLVPGSKGFSKELVPPPTEDWIEEEDKRKKRFSKLPGFSGIITKQIKSVLRQGVPDEYRRKWWFVASGGYSLMQKYGNNWETVKAAAKKDPPTDISNFGGGVDLLSYFTGEIAEQTKEMLHVIWSRNRHIEFAPIIPTVTFILLMYMEPPLAYLSIQAMINKSDDDWFFTLTRDKFLASGEYFREALNNKVGKVAKKCVSLGIDIAQLGIAMFPLFFMPFTPLNVALTFFDSFVFEGRKILFRYALSLFDIHKKKLLAAETPKEFLMILIKGMNGLSTVKTTTAFITNAFSFNISRGRHIKKCECKAIRERSGLIGSPSCRRAGSFVEMISDDIVSVLPRRYSMCASYDEKIIDDSYTDNDVDNENDEIIQLALKRLSPEEYQKNHDNLQKEIAASAAPTVLGDGKLLTPQLFYLLRSRIPISMKSYPARLVFSLSTDGTSIKALCSKSIKKTSYLMMIKTANRCYGAFLSDPIANTEHNGMHYGRPYCFIFTCLDNELQNVYKKTPPSNNMFISVTEKEIFIGGPQPAIILSDGFMTLNSEDCETFGSPSLTEGKEERILDLEVYQLSLQ